MTTNPLVAVMNALAADPNVDREFAKAMRDAVRQVEKPDNLIPALVARMLADPKEAMLVIVGAAYWPPEESLDDLGMRAANLADDYEELRKQGHAVSQIKIDMLRAAEECFVLMEQDARAERKLAQWAAEDLPAHRMPRFS